jgi:flavin-dependent dehydrogenase
MYDAIVAGGSISGLLAAREIAKGGNSVLVLEEGFEVGSPEHCGGLVSKSALNDLGIEPSVKSFDSKINSAIVFSPNGNYFAIDSTLQQIIVVNRRELDKQAALQAKQYGAEIIVKASFKNRIDNKIETSIGNFESRVFVDCRGASVLVNKNKNGVYPTAQYEVYADWIKEGQVEVYFDQEKFPGFFAWIIPSGEGVGKVGVAGNSISSMSVIDEFLKNKGNYSVIRKIYAPIWIKGPIRKFVDNTTITVGDAAGQSKPTTAGGIFSCGMGGIYAGKAISEYLKTNDKSKLLNYENMWREKFGKEFEKQILARKILSRLDNSTVNKLFDIITPETVNEISKQDDFDFHTGSIIKLLGLKGSLSAAQTLVGNEIKKLIPN